MAIAQMPMEAPVPFWKAGTLDGQADAAKADAEGLLLLDLGEQWTPYIFTDATSADDEPKPMRYRPTYLALARGEFPDDQHGQRARRDKYLELYGILPTIGLLRDRFTGIREQSCAETVDLEPLLTFDGFLAYRSGRKPIRRQMRYDALKPQMQALVSRLGVASLDEVTAEQVPDEQWEDIEAYKALAPEIEAIAAAQARLDCEGFFEGRGEFTPGLFDWRTHEALAEFERRHRVYGWGVVGGETLEVLRSSPEENEQEAVIRVLTERAIHAAQVLEDGSTSTLKSGEPRTYKTEDGRTLPIPNFEAELRERVIQAFGLQTPESTYAWLQSLGDLGAHEMVAINGIVRPPYYTDDMDLEVVIDRGDVWYEFPFNEEGKPRPQPVNRRPRITVFLRYNGQKIPLAQYGTTVGGWRPEYIDGAIWARYKDSPVGKRVWSRIAAAPIWVPPESTPPKALLTKNRKGELEVAYHDTGPSYASAYGLVAAYHRKFYRNPEGEIQIGGDEGIRTHGSVDYMSIMRRHSHGCHRLHNHIAVRLMSFVLEHRPHTRYGHQPMVFKREFDFEEETFLLEFNEGGYNFVLDEPLPVEVVIGRVRGQVKEPIDHPIPRFDREVGAYVLPDGEWVEVDRFGNMTPRIRPFDFDAPLEAPSIDPALNPNEEIPTPFATDPALEADDPAATTSTTPTAPSATGESSTVSPAAIPINTAAVRVAPPTP